MGRPIKIIKLEKYLLVLLFLVWSQTANSYIQNQTKSGIPLHWSSTSSIVDISVNSQNSEGISESLVQSIASSSVSEWNGNSKITLRKNTTTGKDQRDLNELYFSSDANYFNGSSVVGITLVSFSETTGVISTADILIKDNYSFSTDVTDMYYLGNVISHELGHFLGLGHGQVVGSTMYYSLSLGQNKISEDDRAGLYTVYPNSDTLKGALSGTIVGGKKLIGVFGAHVQAISVKTGKVIGAAVSELNGKFKINGLLKDDQYLIYTAPINKLGVPSNYANARSDFCESSTKYRGSFFQSCGASSEGFPQAIKLNSSALDVGNITIRCGLDVPPEYLQNKLTTPANFNISSYSNSGLGGSFVGFFSNVELAQASVLPDYFKINFSHVTDWDEISKSTDLYVEVKVINQAFNSAFKPNISARRGLTNTAILPTPLKYQQNSDGWVDIDTVTRLSINRSDSSDNSFEIKVAPDLADSPSGIPFTKADLFPAYPDLYESLYFYLVTVNIVKANGDGTYTQVSSREDVLSDNTRCPDAINTYALTSYTANGTPSSSEKKKAVGCGTVDDTTNNTRGGPGGFMVGLLLCFIISTALSRYSKMA